ncbi:hypothetical protein J437_LFUL004107 [Ladona fulva]|uniref:Major facilitator superfamily (MFS) profile domain-containing protein n=1 Tax=Ladona fulva TaxID=123851 RepID=A0A8K0JX98_LADFU|nr:hypothetical protein J437_LFUL004107 [Ladona fulva]
MDEANTNVDEKKTIVDEENSEAGEISEPRKVVKGERRKKSSMRAICCQLSAGASATTFSFSLGNALGWSSPALPKLDAQFSEESKSWISSVLTLGAAFACFYSGFLMDKLGRRFTMLLQVVPLLLSWMMLTFGRSFIVLLLGRFILGMAGGAICMVVPVYLNEISLPEIRGKMGTLFQLSITFGILHIYLVGKHASLSVLSGTSMIFPILALVTMYFLPESPNFLVSKGKFYDAEKSLKWYLKSENVDLELEDLAEFTNERNLSLMSTLKSKTGRRATMIILALMFFQQFSGINVAIFFSVDLFKAAKTDISEYDATIVMGATQWLATLLSNSIVDFTGRRLLMLISLSGMTLTQVALAVYFTCPSENSVHWLPLFSVCMYIISFSFGAGPLPWSMLGELLPPNAKGPISSLAVISNWMMAFIVTVSFSSMKSTLGNAFPFWFYAAICCVGVAVTFVFLPETKGKTLSEIQDALGEYKMNRVV